MPHLTLPRPATTPAPDQPGRQRGAAQQAERYSDPNQKVQPSLIERGQGWITGWLTRYSIDLLRMSLGLIFLGFGALKFIPGASPAEDLVLRTVDALSLGIVTGQAALLVTAVAEVFIGLTLITGRLLRLGLLVLAGAMVGIMAPLVLFFTDLFPGPPTLEAQYVLKDIVLVAAGLVVAARALGARLVAS